MKRFAQNKKDAVSSWEQEKLDEEKKKIEKFLESEKDIIKFCADLRSAGEGLKQATSKIPGEYFLVSAALSVLGDKFISIGNETVSYINARKTTVLSFQSAASFSSLYQPTSKTPGLKRYIPFVGDVLNYKYTQTLSLQKDLITPIETIFKPFYCDKSHGPTKAPVTRGLAPNFFDHPELDDQYRAKTNAIANLAFNLGAQLQNIEALLAWLATAFGQIELVAVIRGVGGIIQSLLMLINVIFSPNTADLITYSQEGFEGGGVGSGSPIEFLNKIPGFLQYSKKYEAKPLAQESVAAGEKILQNFIYIDVDPQTSKAIIRDKFYEEKKLGIGETWDKYKITITYIALDHVEYKDQYGNKYSIRKIAPGYATPEVSMNDRTGTAFRSIMQDVANLKSSGVNGNVDKLLSKKIADIISLTYQVKNKYPWIGDTKNEKWTNLQSDILTHNTRPYPRTIVRRTKRKETPMVSPVNPNQTPGKSQRQIDIEKEMKRREDLPPL